MLLGVPSRGGETKGIYFFMITIFRNLFSTDVPFYISLDKAINRIRNGKSKQIVEQIRSTKDDNLRAKLKQQLPAILFAGTFAERNKKGIKEHSGLMVLDFDKFENEDIYNDIFNRIKANNHFILAFRSPSGNGIKGVIKIPKCTPEEHEHYFKAFDEEFQYPYFDNRTFDVSRVCFESYDPDLYYNPKAITYSPKLIDKGYKVSERVVYTPIADEDKIISKIMQWNWSLDFQKGQRNNFAFVLAMKFCEYGINEQTAANYISEHYSNTDFTEREIKTTVKSAYKKATFGVYSFVDYEAEKQFKHDIKHKKKDEVIAKYNISEEDYNKEKEDVSIDEFWVIDVDKNGNEKIKVDPFKYKIFLEQNGFKKAYLNESQKPTFVKIFSNIVEETSIEKIKDFVLDYLLNKKLVNVWNYFASYQMLFSESYLLMLDSIELMMLSDTKDKSFIAFKNGILEVDKINYKLIDYIDVDGYIWKTQIIERNFKKDKTDNDYKNFIKNISHESTLPMESIIGYLISTYKNKINNKAIIFNDETISDNPEGGTGKGLIVQGLRQIRKTAILDGKTFDEKKSFPYQTVSKDTQILVFDDVKKHWDFESKFSIVTEGITLERKNKDAIKLTVEQSPKIVVSTNYVIRGSGNSHDRRRHEIEVAQFYGKHRTPYDDFGKQLFDDWDEDEFNRFDNYMVQCLQLYLKNGLIDQFDAKNIKVRKFIAETNKDFYEWAIENLTVNVRHYRKEKYNEFIQSYPDYGRGKFELSQKSFKIYIDKYAEFIGMIPVDDKDIHGRYSMIIDKAPF